MAKVSERLRAEELRKKGHSVRDIATKLGVSRASASVWCRDVSLTKKQEAVLYRRMIEGKHRGRVLGSRTNHLRKLATIEVHKNNGVEYVGSLSPRELMLVGTAIYWGEGSKKSRLNIINSDADMILFMYRWFQIALGIPKADFTPRIFINALHMDRDKIIKRYWATLLDLPKSQFRKTIFIKRPNTKRYSNHDSYFGLLSLGLRNSGEVKYKILGLIEGIKHSKLPLLSG